MFARHGALPAMAVAVMALLVSLLPCLCAAAAGGRGLKPSELPPQLAGYVSGSILGDKYHGIETFYWLFGAQEFLFEAGNQPFFYVLGDQIGETAQVANFFQMGPYELDDGTLVPRAHTWNSNYSIVFWDVPAHTGFSLAHETYYQTNMTDIVEHLYQSLLYFYQVRGGFITGPIYVVGQGPTAGLATHLVYRMLEGNENGQVLNIRGLVVDNGMMDPTLQLPQLPGYLYNFGLLDEPLTDVLQSKITSILGHIQNADYVLAGTELAALPAWLSTATGNINPYDIRSFGGKPDYSDIIDFLNSQEMRQVLNVGGNMTKLTSKLVADAYLAASVQSSIHLLPDIIKNMKVLFMGGMFDLMNPPITQDAWIEAIPGWEGIANATRQYWKVNGELAGYVRQYKAAPAQGITQVTFVQSGRHIAADQPERAYAAVTAWIMDYFWS